MDYAGVRDYENAYRRLNQNQSGDPEKATRALIALAAADNPPKRIYLGADSFAAMERKMGKEWRRKWRRGRSCRTARNMRGEAA